jgi:putative ABC transport system ATP-binding protein
MMRRVLEARAVTKTFGEGPAQVQVLHGIDLSIPAGRFTAIVGPSGSGKSTLLHLLSGVEQPTSGQILLEEQDLAMLSDDERALIRRRRLGLVFQQFNLLPTLSAAENVTLPLLLDGVSMAESAERGEQALALVGLEHRATHRPSQLSGGEQQRVAVARALVIRPAVVLADEPTGSLDSETGRQVVQLLRDLVSQQGQTIVMITHDRDIAAQADSRIYVRDGHIERHEEAPVRRPPL